MNTSNFPTSACRVCRYFQPEGRRGGLCQQLGVPVKASWKACSLALPPFAPSWENMEVVWQDEKLMIEETLRASSLLSRSEPDLSEEKSHSTPETVTAEILLV
jgi:hypothetical protein